MFESAFFLLFQLQLTSEFQLTSVGCSSSLFQVTLKILLDKGVVFYYHLLSRMEYKILLKTILDLLQLHFSTNTLTS